MVTKHRYVCVCGGVHVHKCASVRGIVHDRVGVCVCTYSRAFKGNSYISTVCVSVNRQTYRVMYSTLYNVYVCGCL